MTSTESRCVFISDAGELYVIPAVCSPGVVLDCDTARVALKAWQMQDPPSKINETAEYSVARLHGL